MGSEQGETLDDMIDGEELHDLAHADREPVHMEECKNGRFRRVTSSPSLV